MCPLSVDGDRVSGKRLGYEVRVSQERREFWATEILCLKSDRWRNFPVLVQWLSPMQRAQVQSLVRELDLTCCNEDQRS